MKIKFIGVGEVVSAYPGHFRVRVGSYEYLNVKFKNVIIVRNDGGCMTQADYIEAIRGLRMEMKAKEKLELNDVMQLIDDVDRMLVAEVKK